jgi:hypothetical protein
MSMNNKESLMEVREFTGKGYSPVVDYGAWRVAILNYTEDLLPEKLSSMQRHNETDEVFLLLRGRCILFIGEGDDPVAAIHAEDMKPYKIYNVKKRTWHTHTLSPNSMVLVVENKDTTFDNSPFSPLNGDQKAKIIELTSLIFGCLDTKDSSI